MNGSNMHAPGVFNFAMAPLKYLHEILFINAEVFSMKHKKIFQSVQPSHHSPLFTIQLLLIMDTKYLYIMGM